jgi:prepilin-type N-terminal cleavage/methylation domain-containing protein/prepilin-type processing-associated H-X9-DG protein
MGLGINGFSPIRRRGFTLVELLVVIGILAVLIAILMPVLSRVRKNANTVTCLSNLRQIGICLREYAVANRDGLPPGFIKYDDGEDALWVNFVNAYFTTTGESRQTTDGLMISKIWICPEGTFPDHANYYTAHPVAFPDYTRDKRQTVKPMKFGKLRSDNILVMDGVQSPYYNFDVSFICYNLDEGFLYDGYYYIGTPDESAYQNLWYYDPTDPYQNDPLLGNNYPIQPGPNDDTDDSLVRIRWRHRDSKPKSTKGCANFLFGDGHVDTLGQGDVLRKMILLNR